MRYTCRSSKTSADDAVELARGRQVAAERLLDDDARPAAAGVALARASRSKAPLRARPASPSRLMMTSNWLGGVAR